MTLPEFNLAVSCFDAAHGDAWTATFTLNNGTQFFGRWEMVGVSEPLVIVEGVSGEAAHAFPVASVEVVSFGKQL